jgi:MFS transporter, DHA2 family, glioxin efflux transporter
MKYVFLPAIVVFEAGCLICALSPNSPALIIGRAVQGGGAAGLLLGTYSISNFIVPPNQVPLVVGLIGTIFSVAGVLGPLLGGVFTSDLSWRWCFYINLPIGVVPFSFVFIFFKTPEQAKELQRTPLKEIMLSFDPFGILTFLASLICYFLAMSWGGIEKSWGSAPVVGLLVGWILLTILFIANEAWQGERALVVLRLMKNKDILIGSIYIFL